MLPLLNCQTDAHSFSRKNPDVKPFESGEQQQVQQFLPKSSTGIACCAPVCWQWCLDLQQHLLQLTAVSNLHNTSRCVHVYFLSCIPVTKILSVSLLTALV
jgi:hypothetical protein